MKSKKKACGAGFTLVEAVVCMAVAAILVSASAIS
jgi:prepilin-type N-terminal cleavage/methylation domain-containing protein